ncbi:hypothetical protein HOLleu_22668 [Holothuria leucospilota]|uniref:C2H2-type domain-containing protein n=1 Tax=Holothuria leucospilota TaxID=206669 RepID=A0A9Q1H4S4_HOLLE|nr:hypothetical protein HOLleu_22668 [Holothuria leucospilota]
MDIKSGSGAVCSSSSYVCQTRLFKPNDKFFEDGDVYCSLQSKQHFIEEEDVSQRLQVCEFHCHIASCSQVFISLTDYESHYNSVHRNVCRICHRVLPSNHLLEIHVLEWHDTLFDVLAERQPMVITTTSTSSPFILYFKNEQFQCLVQGCPERFLNQGARKDHLVSSHHYPRNFRFDKKLSYKSEPSNDCGDDVMEVGMDDEDKERERKKRLPRKQRVPAHISFGRGGSRTFQRKSRNQVKEELTPGNIKGKKENPQLVVDSECTEESAMDES